MSFSRPCVFPMKGGLTVRNELITLLKTKDKLDADGYKIGTEILSECEVFAEEKSITREEYFKAMQSGVSAVIAFSVDRDDYDGEDALDYNGERYYIYRTYSANIYDIELMCSKERVKASGRA